MPTKKPKSIKFIRKATTTHPMAIWRSSFDREEWESRIRYLASYAISFKTLVEMDEFEEHPEVLCDLYEACELITRIEESLLGER
jgi:hypothetical protein